MDVSQYRSGVRQQPKRQRGKARPRPPLVDLEQPGWLYVGNLLWIFQISASNLYDGLRRNAGETRTRYPQPDGKSNGRPVWRTSTIKDFLESGLEKN